MVHGPPVLRDMCDIVYFVTTAALVKHMAQFQVTVDPLACQTSSTLCRRLMVGRVR